MVKMVRIRVKRKVKENWAKVVLLRGCLWWYLEEGIEDICLKLQTFLLGFVSFGVCCSFYLNLCLVSLFVCVRVLRRRRCFLFLLFAWFELKNVLTSAAA